MDKDEQEIFKTVLCHLISARSAYDEYVGEPKYRGKQDTLKRFRLHDMDNAITAGRALRVKLDADHPH